MTNVEPAEPEFTPVIAWFSELSTVNQLAASLDPRGWAEAQGRHGHDVNELERRACEWRAYLEQLVT